MKKLLLGTAAGFLWFYAISLMVSPIYAYQGILPTLGCIIGGVMLFGLGCTAAMAAETKGDKHVRKVDERSHQKKK